MKVWITKYALTKGIIECDGAEVCEHSLTMVIVPWPGGLNNNNYFHGGDWHMKRSMAVCVANRMRDDRIRSLKKSLTKLEKLNFE